MKSNLRIFETPFIAYADAKLPLVPECLISPIYGLIG